MYIDKGINEKAYLKPYDDAVLFHILITKKHCAYERSIKKYKSLFDFLMKRKFIAESMKPKKTTGENQKRPNSKVVSKVIMS